MSQNVNSSWENIDKPLYHKPVDFGIPYFWTKLFAPIASRYFFFVVLQKKYILPIAGCTVTRPDPIYICMYALCTIHTWSTYIYILVFRMGIFHCYVKLPRGTFCDYCWVFQHSLVDTSPMRSHPAPKQPAVQAEQRLNFFWPGEMWRLGYDSKVW